MPTSLSTVTKGFFPKIIINYNILVQNVNSQVE